MHRAFMELDVNLTVFANLVNLTQYVPIQKPFLQNASSVQIHNILGAFVTASVRVSWANAIGVSMETEDALATSDV